MSAATNDTAAELLEQITKNRIRREFKLWLGLRFLPVAESWRGYVRTVQKYRSE